MRRRKRRNARHYGHLLHRILHRFFEVFLSRLQVMLRCDVQGGAGRNVEMNLLLFPYIFNIIVLIPVLITQMASITASASRRATVKVRMMTPFTVCCVSRFLTMARLVIGNLHCNYERECHLGSIIRLPLYVHAHSPFWNLTARQEVLFSSHEKAQKTQRITHFMDRVLLSLCFLCCFVARKKS